MKQKPSISPFKVTLFSLPLAILAVFLAKLLYLPAIILDATQIWIHEFGHALIAWFSSRAATPLGIGWTNFNPDKSAWVYICFSFLLGVTAFKGWKAKTYFLPALMALFFAFQTYYTFICSPFHWGRAMSFGGVGGEIYLGALLVIAFFYEFPAQLRWDFFRFPFLLVGLYSYWDAFYLWIKIKNSEASIPWGTLLGGQGDAGGDMNQLSNQYGMMKVEIIDAYIAAGVICGILIVVQYISSLLYVYSDSR
jgi:hypothetical protein